METLDPNSLYTDMDNFIVVLNSKYATTNYNPGFNSKMEFDLPEPIRRSRTDIKLCCSLLSFVCPNSLYNINENNNTLVITLQGFSTNAFVIPIGNYDVKTFMSTISTIIPLNISFNYITNKFTLSYTTNFVINSSSTIGTVMGFSQTISSANNSLTMPYTCNFNGIEQINISLTSVNTNNIDSFTGSKSSVVQTVTIPIGSNQILFQKTNDYNFMISQDLVDDLKIELRNASDNQLLNLNNQHWNIVLMFTVIKDIRRFRNALNFDQILKGF
jgi:hypothetical protein